MGHGKQRTRGARRIKKRPTPLDIISGIDNSSHAQAINEPLSRHSPSRVVADVLRADIDPTERHSQVSPHGTTWPAKPKGTHSNTSDMGPTRIPMGTLIATQAFWAIWVEHREYLRRHSLRWMSYNADDADDALSNAMLLAQRKFPKYAHAITNPRYWLTRLVHNVCMDHHRATTRRQGIESDLRWDALEGHTLLPPRQTVQQPDEEVITEELLIGLQSGLQNLSVSLREPLILRCLNGLTYPDIAARMNLSECAVRKRVQLARVKLGRWKEVF